MTDSPQLLSSPYQLMDGNEHLIQQLVSSFYARMASSEPELARTHPLEKGGLIAQHTQHRFTLFLVEWLGGPQLYTPHHGHPRLRMRHSHVAITVHMRDAWLRCMDFAMDEVGIEGEVRHFLNGRFAEVANFLRNQQE